LKPLLNALFLFLLVLADAVVAAPPVEQIRQLLAQELNAWQLSGINPADLVLQPSTTHPGSYEAIAGTYLFVISDDGGFALRKNLFEASAEAGKPMDEASRAKARRATLLALNEDKLIIFNPPKERPVEYTITVFTDASCPFCAKFHQEVDVLNAEGVKVRYLAYPREGLETENGPTLSYRKTAAVWCNPDPHHALAEAMVAHRVKLQDCPNNPIAAYHALGDSMGVTGTPTLLFENGEMFTGYYSAIDILEYLGNHFFTPLPPCKDWHPVQP
jgi:thiol:disulfide interchange protein DsbC